ncbi:MAG: 50S ribosomal protein L6 [Planctomycetes bacterium RBG_13_50_24]|nr:MAG: 50S ribosomal protein L6 [Planctomycetes bacterium RBG_13_50_24]
MSRIGKKPIIIPQGVKVEMNGRRIKVSSSLGELAMDCNPPISVEIDGVGRKITVVNEQPQSREAKQMHGTMRALIANMVAGVSKSFEKKMEIYGTGYNVKEQGGNLTFQVGFSRPVVRVIPKDVKVHIEVDATRGNEVPAKFTLLSIDKRLLGQFAADIRKIRPPEPYQGKGIRYADEIVRRKVGKAFTSGTV